MRVLATTGARFADFAPYVPAIDEGGAVAFQAALRGGGAGVFTGDGRVLAEGAVYSHPDLAGEHACFYAELGGAQAVVRVSGGRAHVLADTSGPLARIGPLGPTMDERGVVAFRAELRSGAAGIFLADGATIVSVADTSGELSAFQGLPVIAGDRVVYRADTKAGGQRICAVRRGVTTILAETGGPLRDLGRFPSANRHGAVAFAATLADGPAVLTSADGALAVARGPDAGFASFRGALIDDAGALALIATPHGGRLGVYVQGERLVGLGDALLGSVVEDFALNPVSINGRGQLAVRVVVGGAAVILTTRRAPTSAVESAAFRG